MTKLPVSSRDMLLLLLVLEEDAASGNRKYSIFDSSVLGVGLPRPSEDPLFESLFMPFERGIGFARIMDVGVAGLGTSSWISRWPTCSEDAVACDRGIGGGAIKASFAGLGEFELLIESWWTEVLARKPCRSRGAFLDRGLPSSASARPCFGMRRLSGSLWWPLLVTFLLLRPEDVTDLVTGAVRLRVFRGRPPWLPISSGSASALSLVGKSIAEVSAFRRGAQGV